MPALWYSQKFFTDTILENFEVGFIDTRLSGRILHRFPFKWDTLWVLCGHYYPDICKKNDCGILIYLSLPGLYAEMQKNPRSHAEWWIYNSWKLMHCFCCFISYLLFFPLSLPAYYLAKVEIIPVLKWEVWKTHGSLFMRVCKLIWITHWGLTERSSKC